MGCAKIYVMFSVCNKAHKLNYILGPHVHYKCFFGKPKASLSPLFHLPSHLPFFLPLISLYWAEFNPAALRK